VVINQSCRKSLTSASIEITVLERLLRQGDVDFLLLLSVLPTLSHNFSSEKGAQQGLYPKWTFVLHKGSWGQDESLWSATRIEAGAALCGQRQCAVPDGCRC
jgi:hypothetical protein